ncbi:GPT11-like protein, partial [Mya arenaria]
SLQNALFICLLQKPFLKKNGVTVRASERSHTMIEFSMVIRREAMSELGPATGSVSHDIAPFLFSECAGPDTRPSLVPKHVARRLQNERREKIANEKNKQKPKTVLEKEKRDEGLQSAISENNKGFALLQKMGYKPGMALGKFGRGGLGREQDQKRKQEQRMVWRKHQSAKKQRMDSERKQTFVKRMNEKIATRNVGKDLYNSQKGITSPNEAFFWPEALLPKTNDTDECPDTLESLEAGYSGYVQDEVEEEELGHEAEGSEGDEDDPYANFTLSAPGARSDQAAVNTGIKI